MNPFKLSDEEREKIRKKHEEATKNHNDKKETLKKGLQQPEKKKPE